MKYSLKVSSSVGIDYILSNQCEFDEIRKVKENVIELATLEEKLDLVLANYKEFELYVASLAIDYKMFRYDGWDKSMQNVRELSRLFSNLLSATRLYLDHLMRHISVIYGKESEKYVFIKAKVSECYDKSFSYRLMDAIRNHVQHAGLPISYRASSSWDETRTNMLTVVIPVIMIEQLHENKRFKKSVLMELGTPDKNPDLRPHIRKYISSISQIHDFVREETEDDYKVWSGKILELIERGEALHSKSESQVHTTLIEHSEGKQPEQKIDLFRDFLELREQFCKHNRTLKNLECRYISTLAPVDGTT